MLDKSDYLEPCCPFDTDFYKDAPQKQPDGHISVSEMLSQIDRLYARGDRDAIGRVLTEYRENAERLGDIHGELSVLNEMLGHYRMTSNPEKGLAAVNRTLELLPQADIAGSVSAGTILLNAATALRSFGNAAKALQLYAEACRCYAAHLPPEDRRFAGLYNNMASSYDDVGEKAHAETFYQKALAVLEKYDDPESVLDRAVTLLNLAQFYGAHDAADARAASFSEASFALFEESRLPREYYYAHTAEKCAGGFDALGFFVYADTLKARAEAIYRGEETV